MKRIGILTAGGDTPALNAAIHGAVVRANELKIEIFGFIKGFNSFFNPKVPHVHLNPLFQSIPELDATKGGTLIGSSRDYVDPNNVAELNEITDRLRKLGIDGLIAVGGDGTLNGLQPLTERFQDLRNFLQLALSGLAPARSQEGRRAIAGQSMCMTF